MDKKIIPLTIIVIAVIAGVAFYLLSSKPAIIDVEELIKGVEKKFSLESPSFKYGEDIPVKYTLDGENLSPPLSWSDAPPNTKSYVLIMYDPDAPKGIFYHWILYNIPAEVTSLPEGVPAVEKTSYGLQGVNDYGRIGYGGPSPPPGSKHRYIFLLLALDIELNLKPGTSIDEVLKACEGHVIAYAELLGYYGR